MSSSLFAAVKDAFKESVSVVEYMDRNLQGLRAWFYVELDGVQVSHLEMVCGRPGSFSAASTSVYRVAGRPQQRPTSSLSRDSACPIQFLLTARKRTLRKMGYGGVFILGNPFSALSASPSASAVKIEMAYKTTPYSVVFFYTFLSLPPSTSIRTIYSLQLSIA